MADTNDSNYCPVDTEALKPEGEQTVKGSTLVLLGAVVLLLVITGLLAWRILAVRRELAAQPANSPTVTAGAVTNSDLTATPTSSIDQIEADTAALEPGTFDQEFDKIETEINQL